MCFFLPFSLLLTHNRYNKNCSSSCNTPRKLIGHTTERAISAKQFSTSVNNSAPLKSLGANNNVDDGGGGSIGGSKNISRDLFSSTYDSPNESTRAIKMKAAQKITDQSQTIDGFDSMKSPLYSDFTGDLKTTLTPIAVHRLNSPGTHAFSTPAKNISAFSSTSTPSFSKQNLSSSQQQLQQQQYHHHYSNRSGNSHSRNTTTSFNSRQSNDSRCSFDDSSTCFDTSVGMKQSHEKSKDRRNANTSSICLGDFLTPLTAKQHSHKTRKSLNSSDRSPTMTAVATNVSHEKDFPSFTPKGKVNRTTLTPTSASPAATTVATTASTATAATATSQSLITITPKSNQPVKPTKRVIKPTRIGASNNEFNCPAFRSDNNILELPHEENADSTRDLLKSQKDMIRRVFQEEQPPETNLRVLLHENLHGGGGGVGKKVLGATATKNAPPIDLNKISNKPMLDKFIDIYSIILDVNLVTNVLTEVAYLLNLINLDIDEYYERNPHMLDGNSINDRTNAIESTLSKINAVGEPTTKQYTDIDTMAEQQQQLPLPQKQEQEQTSNADDIALNKVSSTCATTGNAMAVVANPTAIDSIHAAMLLLKNINNCVYFGLGVLQLQKNILRMLDVTSIKVLLENERLTTLGSTIKDDLMNVYSHKMQLERPLRTHDTSSSGGFVGGNAALLAQNSSMKVFYQQEQDTQMNFPSTRESAAFKKQRDHFYSILG